MTLASVPRARAAALLGELTAASMTTESAPGRYAFHDLLQVYAAERLDADAPQGRGRRKPG